MPTLFEAAKNAPNPQTAAMYLAVATSDEMISQLDMRPKSGESFVYTREKGLPSAEFVSPTHTTLAESGQEADRVSVPMRLLVSDVDTYIFTQVQQSGLREQMGIQLAGKLKAAGRLIANKAINGRFATTTTLDRAFAGITAVVAGPLQDSDRHGPGVLKLDYDAGGSELFYQAPGDRTFGVATAVPGADGTVRVVSDNPNRYIDVTLDVSAIGTTDLEFVVRVSVNTNEPDGLKYLIPSSMTVPSAAGDANGSALSYDTLDQLIDLVKTNGSLRFVANASIIRKFLALERGLGGTTPEHTMLPGIGAPVPMYRGIPMLRNDWILSDETKGSGTTLSSLYLVDFGPGEEGYFAGVSQEGASDVMLTPRDVRMMGLNVRMVGELEGKEAIRQRVSWYGGFAVGSELAAARATELVTE
jgi:hypothetical protein